jgi:hypothetical protein
MHICLKAMTMNKMFAQYTLPRNPWWAIIETVYRSYLTISYNHFFKTCYYWNQYTAVWGQEFQENFKFF